GVHANVCTRKQSTQSRHSADTQARTHHPETAVRLSDVLRAFTIKLGAYYHLGTVRRYLDVGHHAYHHIFIAHLGLANFKTLSRLEADVDGWPHMQPATHQQRSPHQGRQQRQQPDPGYPALAARLYLWRMRPSANTACTEVLCRLARPWRTVR